MPGQPLLDAFIRDNCMASANLEGESRQVLSNLVSHCLQESHPDIACQRCVVSLSPHADARST